MSLITNHNHKMNKSNNYANERDQNRLFSGLSLAAGNTSGFEVCPSRTPICSEICIGPFSGRGQMKSVQQARINKTRYFIEERKAFEKQVYLEIAKQAIKAEKESKIACIRLNVFSDIAWELQFPLLFSEFQNVIFYDYSKRKERIMRYAEGRFPSNYFLAYSKNDRSEGFEHYCIYNGINVSVVTTLKEESFPATVWNYPAINADNSDSWLLDNIGTIGLLTYKGSVKRLQQLPEQGKGFVHSSNELAYAN